MTTPGFFNIKLFWNKGYEVIISNHEVTNKVLSTDSNYIVDVVMSPKFGSSSINSAKPNFLRGAVEVQ